MNTQKSRRVPGRGKIFIIPMMLLLAFQFNGCGKDKQTAETKSPADYLNMESEMPIVKEKITLRIVQEKGVGQGHADHVWFWKWAEPEMNIRFDITQIESVALSEKINLMFASNELPDVFFAVSNFTAANIFQYGQKEKQLIPLNDLIEKHAPVLKEKFIKDPSARAQATCPDGNIYALPGIDFTWGEQYSTTRPFINMAWLKKLGLKMPETLDEFYTVLKAFKEKDPNGNGKQDEIPLSGLAATGSMLSWAVLNPEQIISAAMGFVETGIRPSVLKDGSIGLFAASPLYKEYLKYMNRLFGEDLLDNDYYTNTAVQVRAKGAELRIGVHTENAPFLVTPNDWEDYEALGPMTSRWNDKKMWLDTQNFVPARFAITSVCRYPEAAMRFADFFYTEKGAVYSYYGPQQNNSDTLGLLGGWFQNENGAVVYDMSATRWTTNLDYQLNEVAPKTVNTFGSNNGLDVIQKMAGKQFTYTPNAAAWRVSMDKYIKPYYSPRYPVVYFDAETNDRVVELTSTINDYLLMMDAKFITGSESLTEIDAYLERLKSLGIEELQHIYQDAYNVYLTNLTR